MKPEPLTSVDDADWLSLRLQFWPDCPFVETERTVFCSKSLGPFRVD